MNNQNRALSARFVLRCPTTAKTRPGHGPRTIAVIALITIATMFFAGCARIEAFVNEATHEEAATSGATSSAAGEGSDDAQDQVETNAGQDGENADDPGATGTDPEPIPDGVEVGDFAAGFPVELFDLPSSCEVLMTSAEAQGEDSMVFSANFRCEESAKKLASHFTSEFQAEGFSKKDSKKPKGMSHYLAFTGEVETITIGILDDGDTRVVTVGGQLMQSVAPDD